MSEKVRFVITQANGLSPTSLIGYKMHRPPIYFTMDYSQAGSLVLSFLCILSAATVDGEIIFRIDPLGKQHFGKTIKITSQKQIQNNFRNFRLCSLKLLVSYDTGNYKNFLPNSFVKSASKI